MRILRDYTKTCEVRCEHCKSILEINRYDIIVVNTNLMFYKCPVCKEPNQVNIDVFSKLTK